TEYGPDGLAVALDWRPAPDIAERTHDLQAPPAFPGPVRRPGCRGLITRVSDREHDLPDPAEQAQPQRGRGEGSGSDAVRRGAQPVPDGVDDKLGDDQLGIIDQVSKAPAGEQFAHELARGPCLLWHRAQRPAGYRGRLPPSRRHR